MQQNNLIEMASQITFKEWIQAFLRKEEIELIHEENPDFVLTKEHVKILFKYCKNEILEYLKEEEWLQEKMVYAMADKVSGEILKELES
jgi:hypothetical protein